MYAFLFLAVPAFLAWFCLTDKKYQFKSYIPALITGFLLGAVICCVKEFLIFSPDAANSGSASEFLCIFIEENLVPLLLLSAVGLLFSKDTAEYKIHAALPYFASAYSTMVPYFSVSCSETESLFMLIISPLLTLFSVILICVLIKKAYLSFTKKQTVKFILFCAAVLAAMAVPGTIRTMWMFRVSAFIYIPLACIFIILSFIFYILNLNDEKKSERQPIFMSM